MFISTVHIKDHAWYLLYCISKHSIFVPHSTHLFMPLFLMLARSCKVYEAECSFWLLFQYFQLSETSQQASVTPAPQVCLSSLPFWCCHLEFFCLELNTKLMRCNQKLGFTLLYWRNNSISMCFQAYLWIFISCGFCMLPDQMIKGMLFLVCPCLSFCLYVCTSVNFNLAYEFWTIQEHCSCLVPIFLGSSTFKWHPYISPCPLGHDTGMTPAGAWC